MPSGDAHPSFPQIVIDSRSESPRPSSGGKLPENFPCSATDSHLLHLLHGQHHCLSGLASPRGCAGESQRHLSPVSFFLPSCRCSKRSLSTSRGSEACCQASKSRCSPGNSSDASFSVLCSAGSPCNASRAASPMQAGCFARSKSQRSFSHPAGYCHVHAHTASPNTEHAKLCSHTCHRCSTTCSRRKLSLNCTQFSPSWASRPHSAISGRVDHSVGSSGLDLQTALGERLYALNKSQSCEDLGSSQHNAIRKSSLQQGRSKLSSRNRARRRSSTNVKCNSNFFGVIQVPAELTELAVPSPIRSREASCETPLLLNHAFFGDPIRQPQLHNHQFSYSGASASSKERPARTVSSTRPSLCRLTVLLVAVQLLLGAAMAWLGLSLCQEYALLHWYECAHWASFPLLVSGIAGLLICKQPQQSEPDSDNCKCLLSLASLWALICALPCLLNSIFSGVLGSKLIRECYADVDQRACLIREVALTTHIRLQDQLIIQCALMAIAAGTCAWYHILLIRRVRGYHVEGQASRHPSGDEERCQSGSLSSYPTSSAHCSQQTRHQSLTPCPQITDC